MAENTFQDDNKIQSTKMYNQQSQPHTISPEQNLISQSNPISNSAGNPIMPHQMEEEKSYQSQSHQQETKQSSLNPMTSQMREANFSVEGSVPMIAALNRLLPLGLKFHLPNQLPGTLYQNPPRAFNRGYSGQKPTKRKKVVQNSTPIQSVSQNSQNQDEFINSHGSQHNIKRSNRQKKPNPKHDLGYIQPRANMTNIPSQGNSRRQLPQKLQTQTYKKCEKIFSIIKKHKFSPPFLYPVDPQYLQIPDYFEVIKQPMDLSTVEARLKRGEYTHSGQFHDDMTLIWNNSLVYNKPQTQIYQMTVELKAYYERLYNVENAQMYFPQTTQFGTDSSGIQQHPDGIQESKKSNTKKKPSKNKKKNVNRSNLTAALQNSLLQNNIELDPSYLEREMTAAEKNYLGKNIKQLQPKYLHGIIDMMRDMNSSENQQVLQFDIDQLPNCKLRQLEKYVSDSLKMEGKTPHRVKQNKNSGGSKKKKQSQKQQQQQASNQQEGSSISKQIGDSNSTALFADERAHNSAAQAAQHQIKKKQIHGQSSSSDEEQGNQITYHMKKHKHMYLPIEKGDHNSNQHLHEQQQKQAQIQHHQQQQQQQEQFLEQQRQQYYLNEQQQQARSQNDMSMGIQHQIPMGGHSQTEYIKKMMQNQAQAGQYMQGFSNPAQMMMYPPPPPPPQYSGNPGAPQAQQQPVGQGYYQPDYPQQYQGYYNMQGAPLKQQRPQDGKPNH